MGRALFIVAMAGAVVTQGQPPAILQNGIFNSASRMPTSLPGGLLAPGARFTIRGVRLGGAVAVHAGSRSFSARLLSVAPREIEAILPQAVPAGEATITVSHDGETSRPFPIRVGPAVGLYSVNRLGWGPGLVERVSSGTHRLITAQNPAVPGDTLAVTVTGLGARLPELTVGGRPARGIRATGSKIVFELPPDVPQGCYVPLYARTASGITSNVVTLPVARTSDPCPAPEGWPEPAMRSGIVLLSRLNMLLEIRPGDPQVGEHESVNALFVSSHERRVVLPLHLIPPAGTCTTLAGSYQTAGAGDFLIQWALTSAGAQALDAGGDIAIAGPQARLNLFATAPGVYEAHPNKRVRQPFFGPAEYKLSSQGGREVGAFAVALRGAQPLVWTDRGRLVTVDRAQGATLSWSGADPNRPVLVLAMSADRLTTAAFACLCVAAPGTTRFTLPPATLVNLPATHPAAGIPVSLLLLMQSPTGAQAEIHARELDRGIAVCLTGSGRSVIYR